MCLLCEAKYNDGGSQLRVRGETCRTRWGFGNNNIQDEKGDWGSNSGAAWLVIHFYGDSYHTRLSVFFLAEKKSDCQTLIFANFNESFTLTICLSKWDNLLFDFQSIHIHASVFNKDKVSILQCAHGCLLRNAEGFWWISISQTFAICNWAWN